MKYFTVLVLFTVLATCQAQGILCGGNPDPACELLFYRNMTKMSNLEWMPYRKMG